jgi:hypothetical protein
LLPTQEIAAGAELAPPQIADVRAAARTIRRRLLMETSRSMSGRSYDDRCAGSSVPSLDSTSTRSVLALMLRTTRRFTIGV